MFLVFGIRYEHSDHRKTPKFQLFRGFELFGNFCRFNFSQNFRKYMQKILALLEMLGWHPPQLFFRTRFKDYLKTLDNLEKTCERLKEFSKQRNYLELMYDYRCRTLGGDHPDTLAVLARLALACYDSGDSGRAIEYGHLAYDQRRKVLGEENIKTLVSLNNLAWIYWKLGDLKQALELFEKLYPLRCKVLGPEPKRPY